MLFGTNNVRTGQNTYQLWFVVRKGLLMKSAGEQEMDCFVEKHKKWMEETHAPNGTGPEPSPLYYAWSKCDELTNPVDPTSPPSGNAIYCLTEVYKSLRGCETHLALAKSDPQFWAE